MLHFDLDWSRLVAVGEELGATDRQVKYALSRAMRRTEATLRKMSTKGLTKLLQLRAASALRNRLKGIKLRSSPGQDGMRLWYGLNGLPVSSFKGRPRNAGNGAEFRGTQIDGGFVAKSKAKGKQTIFKRKGKERLPIEEQLLPIEDQAIVFIEDEVFDQVLDIFWGHFQRDLQARVKFSVGWNK